AVVEAEPALLEESVPAHLAGQRSTGFGQFRLDERMPGLRHQRRAAGFADGTRHVTAAFDVEDDGGARLTRKYVACVKNQLAVGPDDLPGFGDHADTVRVAVESQAQLTVRCHDMADQVLQAVRIGEVERGRAAGRE